MQRHTVPLRQRQARRRNQLGQPGHRRDGLTAAFAVPPPAPGADVPRVARGVQLLLPPTGRYKVVHVPYCFDKAGGFSVMQVFTVGDDASWRDVPVPGTSCCLDAGIVSIDGKTY